MVNRSSPSAADPRKTTQEVALAKSILARASGTYRKAEFNSALDLAKEALAISEGLPSGEQRDSLRDACFKRIIEALDRVNRLDEGLAEIDRWLSETKRPGGQAEALALRARILYRRGDFDGALRATDEGIQIAQKIGFASGLAALMRYRADTLWLRGEAEQALAAGQQALGYYERLDDPEGRARTLNTVAMIHDLLGNIYQSIQCYLRAIAMMESLGDRNGLRILYSNIGESYQVIYAMNTALYYHEQALEMSGDAAAGDLLRNLGVDMIAVGRIDEGLGFLLQANDVARQEGDKDSQLQVMASMADAIYSLGRNSEARELAAALLNEARELGSFRQIIRASLILGYIASADGDRDGASAYFQEAYTLAERTKDRMLIWRANAALAELLENTDPEKARVHGKIAADFLTGVLNTIEDDDLKEIFRNAPPVARVLDIYGNM